MTADLSRRTRSGEFVFLHMLRSVALLLILYDHLFPGSYYMAGIQPPVSIVEEYVLWPLAITNYFGAFGVDVFFLISGFSIAHSSTRKSKVNTFIVRRLFRIVPPILFGFAVFFFCFNALNLIENSKFVHSTVSIYLAANSALWTMKVEICFYLLFAAILPIFNCRPFIGVTLLLAITIFLSELGLMHFSWFWLGQIFSYMFYIFFGMVIYLAWRGDFDRLKTVLLSVILWICIVRYNIRGFNPERYETANSFGVSAAYAVMFFLIFLLAEDRLQNCTWSKKISQYSFGMYLHHMPAQAICFMLFPAPEAKYIPVIAGAAILFSIVASMLQIQIIERPCSEFAKKCFDGRFQHELR